MPNNQPATDSFNTAAPAQAAPAAEWATLRSPLAPDATLARLEARAKRGKLAGFERKGNAAFEVEAYAAPFNHTLRYDMAVSDTGCVLTGSLVREKKVPAFFLALAAFTIWPGVWFTDSLLKTYFESYDYATWMWYLPLTILPLPWYWVSSVKKSRAMALASADEQAAAIGQELGSSK